MVDAYRLRSPLAHLRLGAVVDAETATGAGVTLSETPFRGQINIRGDINDATFAGGVKKATRLELPTVANTVSGKPGTTRIFWLGPDEWMVVTKPGGGERMFKALWKNLKIDGLHASVVDTSDARTTISVSGSDARAVMAKLCSLDLHPREFGPGQCAQTVVGKVGVMMTQTAETKSGGATYELYMLRSFSTYLWKRLEDAATEYGLEIA